MYGIPHGTRGGGSSSEKEVGIDTVTIPLLKKAFKDHDWEVREWDYPLGYIEMDYVGLGTFDSSKLIFMRNSYTTKNWNGNKWDVTVRLSPVIHMLTEEEIELIHSLLTALRLSDEHFIKEEDLIESDRDKLDERHEYIEVIMSGEI